MVLEEVEKTVQSLSRTEKLRLIQFITVELLADERLDHFEREETCGVWSAHDEERAARQLAGLLERES